MIRTRKYLKMFWHEVEMVAKELMEKQKLSYE
jgi:hypothetical protein